jgi:hypothetical protein
MGDDVLGGHIRRTNQNTLISGLLVIAAVVAAGVLTHRFLVNVVAGPVVMTAAELERVSNPGDLARYFVTVRAELGADTGVQQIEQRTRNGFVESEKVVAKYMIAKVGERALIVKAPLDAKARTFTGVLRPISDEMRRFLVDPVTDPALRARYLPFFLDADRSFRLVGFAWIAGGLALLALGARNISVALRRSADRALHPLVERLGRLGDATAVAERIEAELRAGGTGVACVGDVRITPSWLVAPSPFDVNVIALRDVLWVYKRETQKRVGIIPAGKTYAAVVEARGGEHYEVSTKEKDVDRLVAHVAHRAPWAVSGYSDDADALWASDPRVFEATVEARRRELAKASAPAPARPVATSTRGGGSGSPRPPS